MKHILVTGGTGALGSLLVPRLLADGHQVRVISRRPRPAADRGNYEWAQAVLASGEGLEAAVTEIDTIFHLASTALQGSYQVDVEGTKRLLEVAKAANVSHFIYISIVGIDRIPMGYYQHKLAAEEAIVASGVPWTILRATQFHTLLDLALSGLAKLPVLFLPAGFKFQLVDPAEVAVRLAAQTSQPPAGRLPDLGGPQILPVEEAARAWLKAKGVRRPIISLPWPGKTAAAFRVGYNTIPDIAPNTERGKVTWAEWLRAKYKPNSMQPGRKPTTGGVLNTGHE